MANLDGSELVQLTNDGAGKNRMQWLPDGSGLVYLQGKCVKTVDTGGRVEVITCFDTAAYFEDFAVSPDGTQVAISIDHEYLFIVPFDKEKLSQVRFRRDLVPLATCEFFAPYGPMQFKDVQWSKDSKLLAMVIGAPVAGKINDIIEVRDFSTCVEIPRRVGVQFPTNYFSIKGYNSQPFIQTFGWDGQALFSMTGILRNGGYGDLYIYNSDNNRADLESNPIGGECCYRDPTWSPDGAYLTFAYQAYSQTNKIEIYVVRYGDIGTGQAFQPIPLPEDMFPNRDENPQPVLRAAQSP
jgi:WD40-like Beta Propeller Repeat